LIGVEQVFYAVAVILYLTELKCLSEEVVQVGHVTHFFSKIGVAVVELTAPLVVGDRILVKGPSTDFEQIVESMQIEHKNIQGAEAGQSIGLKLAQQAKERDAVYKKL
jgi:putative protease